MNECYLEVPELGVSEFIDDLDGEVLRLIQRTWYVVDLFGHPSDDLGFEVIY